MKLIKVDGTKNLADALTKHLDQQSMLRHVVNTGCCFAAGRHELMPNISGGVVNEIEFAKEGVKEDDSEEGIHE